MKHRTHGWFLTIIFCLTLLSMSVFLFFGNDRCFSEKEKRYLATAPEFSVQAALDGTFREALESWIEDRFPGRDLWVGIHAYMNYLVGRNATNSIYLADDGYLINAPASGDLTLFETTIGRFETFAQKTGLPASLLMVPSNGWLKTDLLPLGHGEYPDDLMFAKAEMLTDQITCVDLRETLRAADAVGQTAYKTDHHLTSFGNYSLYSGWRSFFGKEAYPQSSYCVDTIPGFYGTTWSGSGYWLTPSDDLEIWDRGTAFQVKIWDGAGEVQSDSLFFRDHLDSIDKYPVFLDGNHALTTITNSNGTEGVLLVIKDSYAHGFVPFLAEHYETIYMIDLRYYRGNITEFISKNNVDELLFFYGTATLLTDSNSAWLF